MKSFNVGVFKDVETKNPKLIKDIWNTLSTNKNIIRMQAASDLKKPAVLVVWKELLNKFPKDIHNDRVKQMTGNMIRQILEQNGYRHEKYNIPVANQNDVFTYASRYEEV